MKHIKFISAIAYVLLLASCGSSQKQSTPESSKKASNKVSNNTNVIWIITDEHNFRTIGAHRDVLPKDEAYLWGPNAYVETPHLDGLAKNGVIFNRMYCSAAVCTASRASMFTGMYPMTLGIPNNSNKKGDGKYLKPDVVTIADVLSDAGYMTGYSGKWHLAESKRDDGKKDKEEWWSPYPVGAPEDTYGFQDKRYMFNGGHDKWKGMLPDGTPYKSVSNTKSKTPKLVGTDKYGQPVYKDSKSENVKFTTDWLTDRTVDFIGEHKDKPFFYVVSIPDPHTPNVVRAPYDTMYEDMEITVPKTYHMANAVKMDKNSPKWQKPDAKATNQKKLIEEVRQYFGMVKCIDDNVGRIIQKLKDEGVFENTIVMFSSDHGDLLGEHARVNKGTAHEASAKIPFIMAQGEKGANPLVPRNKVVKLAANNTDWMPTFLSMLNVDCPKVAGRDLTPILDGVAPSDWKDITYTRLGHYVAITERYKLHFTSQEKPWLFDIEADPNERVNFIDDPKYRQVVIDLAHAVEDYMALSGDNNEKIQARIDSVLR